jgi:ankyrin repeat protein
MDIYREVSITGKLIRACKDGNLSVVRECVNQGAGVRAANDLALRWATSYGRLEVVKYLIEQGANIHAMNDWPLRRAAEEGHLETVKCSIENGAYIHAENDWALRRAARNRHFKVVNYLRRAAGDEYKCHRCLIRSTCLDLCEDFRQY